jgi:hypothetical protein
MAASSYHQLDSYPEGVSSNNRSSGRPRPRKFQRYKRYLRICKIASKAITVTFSAIMFACMVFMTVKYQTTKDEIRNGRTAWPTHPKLWPTFLLLAGAGLTLLLSAVTAISYCLCFDESRRSWKLTVVKYLIHILTWIIISTLYRYEKGLHGIDNDLWGWSCSQKAAVIQSEFNGVVNFESLCSIQVRPLSRDPYDLLIGSLVQIMDCFNRRVCGKDCVCRRAFCSVQEDPRWRETETCEWSGRRSYELVRGRFLIAIFGRYS